VGLFYRGNEFSGLHQIREYLEQFATISILRTLHNGIYLFIYSLGF
jgi:hypothetical protein